MRDTDAFIDHLAAKDFVDSGQGFDQEDIEFIRKHPEVLARLSDPSVFKKRYALAILAAALVMMVVAKALQYSGALDAHPIAQDLLTNVMFSIATELTGAMLVVFLMELLLERRVEQNRALLDRLQGEVGD